MMMLSVPHTHTHTAHVRKKNHLLGNNGKAEERQRRRDGCTCVHWGGGERVEEEEEADDVPFLYPFSSFYQHMCGGMTIAQQRERKRERFMHVLYCMHIITTNFIGY